MEAFGMQMPVNADFTGFEMSMSVEDGKAEIILIESGEETKVETSGRRGRKRTGIKGCNRG